MTTVEKIAAAKAEFDALMAKPLATLADHDRMFTLGSRLYRLRLQLRKAS